VASITDALTRHHLDEEEENGFPEVLDEKKRKELGEAFDEIREKRVTAF
jgi:hypothetical protein